MRKTTTMLGLAGLLLATACSDGGDADAGGDPAVFCDQAGTLEQRFTELNQVDPNDTEAWQAAFDELAAYVSGIEPPGEIAEAWQISMSVYDDSDEVDEADLDQAAITEASDNVTSYLRDECGIDLAGDLAGDSAAQTDTTTVGIGEGAAGGG